jgi:hypothetical protein
LTLKPNPAAAERGAESAFRGGRGVKGNDMASEVKGNDMAKKALPRLKKLVPAKKIETLKPLLRY